MATWHQLKAGLTGLYTPHAAAWKVVSDRPGELASVILFKTEREARALAEKNGGAVIAPRS